MLVREPLPAPPEQDKEPYSESEKRADDLEGRQRSRRVCPSGEQACLSGRQAPATLRDALHELGIQPFSPESVERYKRSLCRRIILRASLMSTLPLFVLSLIAPLALLYDWMLFDSKYSELQCLVAFVPSLLALPGYIFEISALSLPTWHRIPLRTYARPIPSYVEETARSVQEQCPHAELFIEELQLLDPLLVAVGEDGHVHYLEVWDEPDFFTKRTL